MLSKLEKYLHIFVEMNRLIIYVVFQEILIHARQESHLRQREDIHELLHGVAL